MARMQVEFNLKNTLLGIAFVVVAMVIFRLALPAILPADMVLAMASAVIGIAFWFLFLISRNKAD